LLRAVLYAYASRADVRAPMALERMENFMPDWKVSELRVDEGQTA